MWLFFPLRTCWVWLSNISLPPLLPSIKNWLFYIHLLCYDQVVTSSSLGSLQHWANVCPFGLPELYVIKQVPGEQSFSWHKMWSYVVGCMLFDCMSGRCKFRCVHCTEMNSALLLMKCPCLLQHQLMFTEQTNLKVMGISGAFCMAPFEKRFLLHLFTLFLFALQWMIWLSVLIASLASLCSMYCDV